MPDYNPDALDESAENAELESGLTGEIADIRQDVAHNIFGEDTQSEPDKEMLIVTVEYEQDGETNEVDTVFSLPETDKSWLNPLFKLARFRSKYGEAPREGMEVEISPNENGFLDIDLPERATIDA